MGKLREIYDDIVSTYAQFSKIHDRLLLLNWRYHKTTVTDNVCEEWMVNESDYIQARIGAFSDRLWKLPEVNGRNHENKTSAKE